MEQLERKSLVEIRLYQEAELQKQLQLLNTYSPFYKSLFSKNKIDVTRIKTLEDLVHIPVTSKNNLQTNNWDFLCVPKNKIAEYCTTSGTTGTPITIALTENDLGRLAYNEYLSFLKAGATADDTFQFMLSLDRQFMAGLAYYSGLRKLGAAIIRVGPGNVNMQMDTILRLHPTVLIAVPSFILNVISYAKEKNIELNSTSVKKIICIGENIRNEDFSLNTLGERIVKDWQVQLHSTYASTEKQTAFTECEHGKGGHHHADLLIFEILDEKNKQLLPGEYGEMTITTLNVEGMPLLRYKTGDICTHYIESCKCGRNTARISPIIGRKQQMIKYNGTSLYPQAMFNILSDIPEVADYVIQVFKSEIGTDDIRINLALHDPAIKPDNKIKKALQSTLRIVPTVSYVPLSQIKDMQTQDGNRKLVKLVDSR